MFSSLYVVSVLLNLIVFFREAELQPTFTAMPSNPFKVLEGDNITLEWSYDLGGESLDRIEFTDVTSSPNIRIFEVQNGGQTLKRLLDVYTGRVQANVTATHTSITIFGANRTVDSKDFALEVLPAVSEEITSDEVEILVQYPPEFTRVSDDQDVVEGGPSITLECIAIGEPPPNITWTRVFDNGSDGDVLFPGEQFVLDNNRNSTGTYRCTAYNGIGTAPNHTIVVDVTYKPENVKLMVNESNICKGDIISITCSADGKPDVHTYQLFENDVPVANNGTTGVWKRTMSTQGNFTYRCVANNTVGTSNKNLTVTVNVPAVVYPVENITVTEGENRTLTCNVSGSPAPSVTWTELKTGIRSKGITRELTHINRNQSGEYKCEASNFCGNDTARTFVIVQYIPENFQFVGSEIKVCQDEVINFTCSADGNPAVHTYKLFKNDTPVTDGTNSHGVWSRTMKTDGVFIYHCVANNTAGTGKSETLTVTVNVASSIQPIEKQTIMEGHNLTVVCNASGIPAPMVTWMKVGGGDISTNGSELVFTNVSRTEAGEYRCEASNECGNASVTATIEVQFKPDNVQLETSAADNKACRGDVISINCSADTVPSEISYQLFENNIAISDTSGMWTRNHTSEGMFMYKCVANTSLGTGESTSVTVTVNVASSIQPIEKQTIMEGHNLTVVCNASGIPAPMVTWIKVGGGDISTNGSELVFTNVSRSEAGEYRCEASNECGNATETATIEVQFKPDNVQLETSAADNKACRDDVLSINCSAEAVPSEISYQLRENDIAILDASGRWNRPLPTAGMFTYKCVPNNTSGAGENATVTVTVNVPSSIQPMLNKTITEEGKNVVVSCNASGTSPVIVSWIKVDGGELFDGKELVFTHINRSQTGEYRCEASNECGNASETATVEVQYKPENVQLKTSVVDSKACKGETVSFDCSAGAVPVVTSFVLFENDSVIMSKSGMWNRTLSRGVFIYKCVANNSLGSVESESVTVTVNVPSAIESIQNKTTTEGGSVTLSCSATGTPHPMVSWLKVDGHIRFNRTDLMFTNINRSQAGEYRCEASNECGNASETATIKVQYPPENVQLTTSAVDGRTFKGETISINCSADAVPSVTSYELFENNSVIMDTSGMWSRILSSGGVFVYKCVASNSLGSTGSESVTVTANVPSSIERLKNKTNVQKGEDVTLYCNVSGTPTPHVSWTRVSTGEKWFSKTKVIVNVKVDDLGEYKCEASNPYGNATKSIFIFFPGGLCEEVCSIEKTCRQFGQYVCLCDKGKAGRYCEENEELKNTFDVGIEFDNLVYKQEYEDLEHPTTETLVKRIEDAVTGEVNGSGFVRAKVTKLRKGSVIADMELTFHQKVGASELETLLSEVTKDGKMGDLEVSQVVADGFIKDIAIPAVTEPAEVNRDVIYGTVIGILALMLTVFIIYVILKHRQRQGDNRLDLTAVGDGGPQLNEGMEIEGSNENVNTTNHHAASQYMALVEVRQPSGATSPETSPYSEINEYAPLHPGTRSWEVPRKSIIIKKIIGKGAFGQVAQGEASQLRGRDGTITVAIKMLKDNPTDKERKDLLSELEVMKKVKPHRHVIKLLGCVTESDPLLVIIEYAPYGDLLRYLRKSRGLSDTYFKDPDARPQTSLTSQQLIKFSWQVADGMRYLSSINIIHRDLAARNVLVGEQETCKLTNFGMARDLNQESIYETKTKSRLPVKWTAYEALLFGRYTTKSDVWSFGIVLYEIFTIGGSPYPRTDPRKMVDILNRGYRMPKPSHVDEALYKIMQDCWREDPDDRPTFENLTDELKEMENQHQRFIKLKDYDKKLYENVEDFMF